MKSKEEVEAKLKECKDYVEECAARGVSSCYEDYVTILEAVLNATNEEIEKFWSYQKELIPYLYGEDRKRMEQEQEDFYNKNLKCVKHGSPKWNKLWAEYLAMDVPSYNEYRWHVCECMGWVMEAKDSHGKPFLWDN